MPPPINPLLLTKPLLVLADTTPLFETAPLGCRCCHSMVGVWKRLLCGTGSERAMCEIGLRASPA